MSVTTTKETWWKADKE